MTRFCYRNVNYIMFQWFTKGLFSKYTKNVIFSYIRQKAPYNEALFQKTQQKLTPKRPVEKKYLLPATEITTKTKTVNLSLGFINMRAHGPESLT